MKTGIALAGVFLAATASAALMHAPAGRAAEAFGVASSVAARGGTDLAAQEYPTTPYNGRFVFTRVRFDDGGSSMSGYFRRGREPWWHHDHPDAEYNFSKILETITYVPPTLQASNILTIEDPRIFQYPILYLVEPGYWRVTEGEIVRLREYLLKGGFIIFDDMDDRQMYRLSETMRRVLPELQFVQLEPDDAIFDSFFAIDPRTLWFGAAGYRGDQIDFWGIYEGNDRSRRLLAVAGNRGDLGDFWEYSDLGFFPIDITNEAYKVGVNYIVYAMTH
jgi:hypothetical protein